MISVLILTKNEEENLPRALSSVAWSDDVVVFDSFSTDRTVELARNLGARVEQRTFDNYAAQRNAALTTVSCRYPWVLMLDADECVPKELADEMRAVLPAAPPDVSLYRMRRRDMFLGHWLRRSSGYPTWFGRLLRVGHAWVEREINEEYHTDGKAAFLNEHLIHFPFSRGLSHWFDRHNQYSTMEALALRDTARSNFRFPNLLARDPVLRRKALKQLAYRLPGRPALVFAYLYFIRLGCFDGKPGLLFCTMRSIYEYMIDIKVRELNRRQAGLPV